MRKNGEYITCKICKKEFYAQFFRLNEAKYCSRQCSGIGKRGKPNWRKGKKFPYTPHPNHLGFIPWNKGIKTGLVPNTAFKKGHIPKSKLHPEIMPRGKNNPAWKGGIYPLTKWIRNSAEYIKWRTDIFKRDNYTCQKCKKKGNRIHAHHKKEFNILFSEFLNQYKQFSIIEDKETLFRLAIKHDPFWDLSNGETLCNECHKNFKINTYERNNNCE